MAKHTDSRAWLKVEIQHDYFRSISIHVADNGLHFRLQDVLPRHIVEFEATGREHGLLLIKRLSGGLWSEERSTLRRGRHEVGCEIYETPLPATEHQADRRPGP